MPPFAIAALKVEGYKVKGNARHRSASWAASALHVTSCKKATKMEIETV